MEKRAISQFFAGAGSDGPQGPQGATGSPAQNADVMSITIDGGGVAIQTGIVCDFVAAIDGTISYVYLLADQAGDCVVDLWKDSYANFPPTVADTITAAAKPTLSSADKYYDGTLTGWTTAVTMGDIIRVNVDSLSTITRLTIVLGIIA